VVNDFSARKNLIQQFNDASAHDKFNFYVKSRNYQEQASKMRRTELIKSENIMGAEQEIENLKRRNHCRAMASFDLTNDTPDFKHLRDDTIFSNGDAEFISTLSISEQTDVVQRMMIVEQLRQNQKEMRPHCLKEQAGSSKVGQTSFYSTKNNSKKKWPVFVL